MNSPPHWDELSFFLKNNVYLFLALLDLCCCVDFPLVVVNWGCCLGVVCRHLIAWLLLLGSTGSRGCKLQQLQLIDSVVVSGLWSAQAQ